MFLWMEGGEEEEFSEGLCELLMQFHQEEGDNRDRWSGKKEKEEKKRTKRFWSPRATRVSEWLTDRSQTWDTRARLLYLDACLAAKVAVRSSISTASGVFSLCEVRLFVETPPCQWQRSLIESVRDHGAPVSMWELLWNVATSSALEDSLFPYGEALYDFLMPYFDSTSSIEVTHLFLQTYNARFALLILLRLRQRISLAEMGLIYYGCPKNLVALQFGLGQRAFGKEQEAHFVRDPPTKEFLSTVLSCGCDRDLLWHGTHLASARALAWHLELDRSSWGDEFIANHLLFTPVPTNFAQHPSNTRLHYVLLLNRFHIRVAPQVMESVTDCETLCALYSWKRIPVLPPLATPTKEEWFSWNPETHEFFGPDSKSIVMLTLLILNRMAPPLPNELRITVCRLVMNLGFD